MTIIKLGNTSTNPISLSKGGHRTPEEGMCIMELLAMLGGHEHSDRPPCTSAVIGVFSMRTHDAFKTDADRNTFFAPLVLRMMGTNQTNWSCHELLCAQITRFVK